MKAKDLAAIAALGIAGKMAYDKFGNKTAPGKASPVYDYDTPKQKEQEAYDYDTPKQKEQEAYDYDTPVKKQKAAPIYDNDTPSAAKKATKKAAAAPAVAVKPVATRSLAPAAEDDYVMPRTAPKPVMPDASRVTPYNSDIMYAPTVKSDPNVAHDDEMNRLARTRATRQGAVVAQSPNDQAQARILRQGATTAQATPYNSDIMYNTTVKGDPSINDADSEINQQAYTRMARQGTAFAQSPNDQAQARLLRQGVRQVQTPNAQAQARMLRQGAGRAKGGAVKMASGGMTSSKMSKPSGASRGDGIAQRGRTRGKYL